MYTYPLTMPTDPVPFNHVRRLVRAEAISESPFTFEKQIHEHSGTKWEYELEYPPMTQAIADTWIVFLLELKGMVGTFYFSDPDGNRGTPLGSPLVNAFAGDLLSVTTTGWTPSKTGLLLKGDKISFSNYEYKTVLEDVNSDGAGAATIYFQPIMRNAVGNGTAIATSAAKGIFRLSSPNIKVSSNYLKHYELKLIIQEDI